MPLRPLALLSMLSLLPPTLLAAPTPLLAPSMPDAAFHTYLASPAFQAVLRAALPACAPGARPALLEVQPLQPVFMGDGAHPRDGLWRLVVDAQDCGGAARQAVTLWAREDDAPRVQLQP